MLHAVEGQSEGIALYALKTLNFPSQQIGAFAANRLHFISVLKDWG